MTAIDWLDKYEQFCENEFKILYENNIFFSLNGSHSIEKNKNHFELLFESIKYSFFNGGKRFRPSIALTAAQVLDLDVELVFPWAMSIEMIHTYSLIHDDLPCMDNDDVRRGKPTNHKVYGEDLALLAGDALLTEAFGILARHYSQKLFLGELIQLLVNISGAKGMIGGQFLDIKSDKLEKNQQLIVQMHLLKTGALISGALSGPALIAGLSIEDKNKIQNLGLLFGYAFQVKDDLLDADEKNQEFKNIIYYMGGAEKTQKYLESIHSEIEEQIVSVDKITTHTSQANNIKSENKVQKQEYLMYFLDWNKKRTH